MVGKNEEVVRLAEAVKELFKERCGDFRAEDFVARPIMGDVLPHFRISPQVKRGEVRAVEKIQSKDICPKQHFEWGTLSHYEVMTHTPGE